MRAPMTAGMAYGRKIISRENFANRVVMRVEHESDRQRDRHLHRDEHEREAHHEPDALEERRIGERLHVVVEPGERRPGREALA